MTGRLAIFLISITLIAGAQPYSPGYPYRRGMEPNQISPQATPPTPTPVKLKPDQTLSQLKVSLFQEFVRKAGAPSYRLAQGQMFNVQPLSEFLLWVASLPPGEATKQRLKSVTRPLPEWTILYGKVAQITDRDGILLWKYEEPTMTEAPKLVRLRSYPLQRNLVDGDQVVVFAKNEASYSYITADRIKATVASYDYGKEMTAQEVKNHQAMQAQLLQQQAARARAITKPRVTPTTNALEKAH